MHKYRILYIVTELKPFLQFSSMGSIAHKLIQYTAMQDHDVRVIMPKFDVMSTRRHRIHEVQRLCGINIDIADEHISLIVKVGPMQKTKTQVYFMDNEDLFQNKKIFRNEDGAFYDNNGIRIIFMSKAALSMVHYLEWPPDIIHCIGWNWAFIPVYGKLGYKNQFIFKNTKYVYTYGLNAFQEKLGSQIWPNVAMQHVKESHLAPLGPDADFKGFLSLAKAYADRITYSFDEHPTEALEVIQELKATPIPNDDQLCDSYQNLYAELLQKEGDKKD